MRKLIKYTAIVLAGVILLITGALLLTQTSFFREQVKSQVVKLIEKQLNLVFNIEELDGNFYNNILLRNVELRDADSLLASFSGLEVNYKLWPLLSKTISIDSIVLREPYVNLWQSADSTWNFSTILPKSEPSTSNSKPFLYTIAVGKLAIEYGRIDIASLINGIPSKINDINLLAGGNYSEAETLVRLNSFQLKSKDPAVALKKLSGKLELNDSGIMVDSLLLVANNSGVNFQGTYFSPENLEGKISEGIVDKNDLALFVPSFKMLCSPSVNADLKVSNDSLKASVVLQNGKEQLSAKLSLQPFSNLQLKDKVVPYQAHVKFDRVNVGNWADLGIKKSYLDGELDLAGVNLKDFKSEASVKVRFENSSFEEVRLKTLVLGGTYYGDSLQADILVQSEVGKAAVKGKLTLREEPEYEAEIDMDKFELSKVMPELAYTMLNGKVVAKGKGFDPEKLLATAVISLSPSMVYEYPIEGASALAHVNGSSIKVDTLQAFATGVEVSGSGQFELDSMFVNSKLNGNITSLQLINSIVDLPVTFDSVLTVATVSGPVAALKIDGVLDLFHAEGYSVSADDAQANYQVALVSDSFNVAVHADVHNVKSGNIELDTVQIDYSFAGEEMGVEAKASWTDMLKAKLKSTVVVGDTIFLTVPELEVNSKWADVYLVDTMTATLDNYEFLEIHDLTLKDRNLKDFKIAVDGNISTSDTGNFEIKINDLDVGELNRFLGEELVLGGKLNSNFRLYGRSDNPFIEGQMEITDPRYGNYALQSLRSDFTYAREKGSIELTIPEMGNTIFAGINAPLSLSLDSLQLGFHPPKTYEGLFILDSIDITRAVKSYAPYDSVRGLIDARIETKGTLDNPQFFGNLHLKDGMYSNKTYGIEYNEIAASVSFNGNEIGIDTVLVKQKNGLISVNGELAFDSTIIKGNISSSSVEVDAKNFFLTRHRNYEVLIDANTFVKSDKDHPEFGGKIKVLRSDLYLPALMKEAKGDAEADVPMLVEALNQSKDSTDLKTEMAAVKVKPKKESEFIDLLTGRLEVEIPRNTWIRSNDIRAELGGELEIVKDGPDFEVFGNVKIIRGHYILYGRKLNLKESEVTFQGGEEFDPVLNLAAEYVYRSSDKEKRYLEMTITGNLTEPEITFFLDDVQITETDGISVLVFGATSDEIGYGGNNGLLNSIGSNALTSMISSQLSKTIGTKFNLDMIEVTTTENWSSAAFVVGKYITNDIFVIYQRGFGEVNEDEITPETIIIEYEINEKLFLRLQSGSAKESGIDVILKFEQEKNKGPVTR
ncbi:translocation/assembly module TamB domain-containing protein [Draconibacterium sp. IB214405]|uniref:translocation/assembly module TamB domain-containing protein n=1 Tax=Draconibacterium sp. IB214405 TaxID=3097352 RepID=UPI002A12D903|nr:translocation/assembly module TamB domain-containing protein [Draconibacterium sp. IB214405]MDX8337981.1 translocation/assembly module TamB domain-containing protein [Draconibacterium sp. IB214405]